METLWTGIKALKPRQYLVMAAVLMGAAGAAYGAPGSMAQPRWAWNTAQDHLLDIEHFAKTLSGVASRYLNGDRPRG